MQNATHNTAVEITAVLEGEGNTGLTFSVQGRVDVEEDFWVEFELGSEEHFVDWDKGTLTLLMRSRRSVEPHGPAPRTMFVWNTVDELIDQIDASYWASCCGLILKVVQNLLLSTAEMLDDGSITVA